MGAKDIKANKYMADNARFADLFNYKLYDGRPVIQPDELQERDATELLDVFGVDKKQLQVQKLRDLLKSAIIKSTQSAFYVLLGLENQTKIHYAMPVRAMLYDAINYEKQINETGKMHKKNKDHMTPAEFLSNFKKTDRLTPIVTLTLYWGADDWDGPTHLHQMFHDMDEHLKQFIPDYHINLIAPNQIQSFEKFRTELGKTLEFIKYSSDTPHFKKMLSGLKNQKLSNETVSVINSFTGAGIKLNEKEEVTDVCLAIEEIKREAAEQAAQQATQIATQIATQKTTAQDLITSVESIMKNFSLSLENACKGLDHTVEEYEKAKKLLETMQTI